MDKHNFIICMKVVHDALYKIKKPADNDEEEILADLIKTYISMIAGFHKPLYQVLYKSLISDPALTDKDWSDLYDMLTADDFSYEEALQ